MAASKQASKHTHARAQCSPASVGLAQARPNKVSYRIVLWGGGGRNCRCVEACRCAAAYPLGFCRFNEILDIFKNKNHRIQLQVYNTLTLLLCCCVVYS